MTLLLLGPFGCMRFREKFGMTLKTIRIILRLPFGLYFEFGLNIETWNLELSRLICLVMEFSRSFINFAFLFGVLIFLEIW